MTQEIIEFLKNVTKKSKINDNTKIIQIEEKDIYIIDNDCLNHCKYNPTLLKMNNKIIFNMNFEQALYYLENKYVKEINKFNNLLNEYVQIYNQIQMSYNIKEIEKHIKIEYNLDTKTYNLYFILFKSSFYTREEKNNPQNGFTAAIRHAMRCDPDVIMIGELQSVDYNENMLLSKNNRKIILFHIEMNLIYSSDIKPLDNMFTVDVKGDYKNSELFDAIQSYLNITESTEYNILDPNIISDKLKLNEYITLSRMIDI